jgi:hypothetical protein
MENHATAFLIRVPFPEQQGPFSTGLMRDKATTG